MNIRETLSEVLGRPVSKKDVAGHIADRISAMEQNRNNFRRNGEVDGMQKCTNEIRKLREQALESDLEPSEYPSIYR